MPLAAGGGDDVYASAFERVVLPVLEAYAPDLVLVSAGFDAAARDPLAQMELSTDAFGWMARALARVAEASPAKGRMALVLEGATTWSPWRRGCRSGGGRVCCSTSRRRGWASGARTTSGVEKAAKAARKAWAGVD